MLLNIFGVYPRGNNKPHSKESETSGTKNDGWFVRDPSASFRDQSRPRIFILDGSQGESNERCSIALSFPPTVDELVHRIEAAPRWVRKQPPRRQDQQCCMGGGKNGNRAAGLVHFHMLSILDSIHTPGTILAARCELQQHQQLYLCLQKPLSSHHD